MKVCDTGVLSESRRVIDVRAQCHDFVRLMISGHSGGELCG